MFKAKVDDFIKSGHVRFVGAVSHDKVVDYLSAADIYVSTSFSDGTSASLLEAMACSLAPVVTEIDGNKEWVKDGENGLVAPLADSKRLAEKILLLATDHELRTRLQINAEVTIKRRVNWARNTEKFFEIINRTMFIPKSHITSQC
jgi:glycosyltransferase involved in cell wall biosynthesis